MSDFNGKALTVDVNNKIASNELEMEESAKDGIVSFIVITIVIVLGYYQISDSMLNYQTTLIQICGGHR